MEVYNSRFLGWCKSYEQEEREIRELIEGEPVDVEMLKDEYEILTGEKYFDLH